MSTTTNTIDTKLLSFTQLFGQQIGQLTIEAIEIPLIQRDYAQGRKGVERIRSQFIDAVCTALLPDTKPIELDFVYGDVENGKFIPLDGQQRLTLLFLLHCYLAWHQSEQPNPQPWAKFSYATRPGAREFCRMLSQCRPHFDTGSSVSQPSSWLIDQAEYLPTWNHDPTIQSMLIVLDDLHQWFTKHLVNIDSAWQKLTNTENPAIRFHLLPMKTDDISKTNPQYIKMNSRGKPLTPFENFKAQFEEKLETIDANKAKTFAKKVDTDWSDTLWEYRGDDNLVDDEFMRYFRFISEVCAWNGEVTLPSSKKVNELAYLSDLAEKVYGSNQSKVQENLDFLFHAFDVWHGKSIKNECGMILTATSSPATKQLLIFNASKKEEIGVDLFHACCRYYGTSEWGLRRTLLFYGMLLRWDFPKQDEEVANFSKHLRILRNLIEASGDGEIREEFMPRLLADVRFVMSGNLDQVNAFNQEQKQNELGKLALLETDPALESILHQLEDHELLRGGLTAFDLEPLRFQIRAQTFLRVFDKSHYQNSAPWIEITGALLTQGNYAKMQSRWTGYHFADFGAPQDNEPWRTLFRGKGKGTSEHPLQKPLMSLLDTLSNGNSLQEVIEQYINNSNTNKDWRYYFVKYETMRKAERGRYAINTHGYEACMLRKDQMNSYHADPYLCAIVQASKINQEAIVNYNWPNSFYGYETNPRWLHLTQSGIKLRAVNTGWEITDVPLIRYTAWQDIIQDIEGVTVTENDSQATMVLNIPQNEHAIDVVDRIEIAANLLRMLVNAGF